MNEALSVIEPGKIFNLFRACALTRRAECLIGQGELENAEEDLKRGRELLETRHAIGPGSIVALACWWEVQSAVHLLRQALDQATDALTKAIQYRQQVLELLNFTNPHARAALLRTQERLAAISTQRV